MIEQLIKEMRATPFTMVLVVGLWVGAGVLWNTRDNYAQASDLAQLKVQLQDVKVTLERSHLDTRLNQVQTELFQLSQKVKDDVAQNKPVDGLYYSRIHDLEVQSHDLERAISNLDRARP